MSKDPPYPLDQPGLSVDIRRLLADYGADFDGATWLLVEDMVYPEEEVFFVTAVGRETVELTRNRMALGLELSETPFGLVLAMKVTFDDYPVNPTVVWSFLNPVTAEVRRWLQLLGGQDLTYVISMDKDTGEQFKTTRLPLAEEYRAAARQILEATREEANPSQERWTAAIDFYHEHTEAPAGHIRLRKEAPEFKAGRNDPCPCGSGKKFKQCHGR